MAKFSEHKKEKEIGEQVIVIAMVAMLMAVLIYNFFKQDNKVTGTGFHAAATAFASKLNLIHAQWFMDKQPTLVVVREFTADKGVSTRQGIPVNNNGWVDVSKPMLAMLNGQSPCQLIWGYLVGESLTVMNMPIAALEINNNSDQEFRVCRYQSPQGWYFDYASRSGKVSEVFYHDAINAKH